MEDSKNDEPYSLESRLNRKLLRKVDELFRQDGVATDLPDLGPCKVGNFQVMGIWKIKGISDSFLKLVQDERNPKLLINRADSGEEVLLALGFIDAVEGPTEIKLDLKKNQSALFQVLRLMDNLPRHLKSKKAS